MCVLTADPTDPTGTIFLMNPAGPVTLQINSLTGSVIFEQAKTTVTDGKGSKITPTFPSPDKCSFTTSAGQNALHTEYVCLPPNSTGKLNEACAGGVELGDILPNTFAQDFTIKA
jgi:hypothetical protein